MATTPRRRSSRPADLDLTGGFRLDLKTILVIAAVLTSWYNQTGRIDTITQRLDLEAKASAAVKAAERDAVSARADLAAQQQRSLSESLAKLEGQLKVTSMDVADLKILTSKGRS